MLFPLPCSSCCVEFVAPICMCVCVCACVKKCRNDICRFVKSHLCLLFDISLIRALLCAANHRVSSFNKANKQQQESVRLCVCASKWLYVHYHRVPRKANNVHWPLVPVCVYGCLSVFQSVHPSIYPDHKNIKNAFLASGQQVVVVTVGFL